MGVLTTGAFATGLPIGFYTFMRWYVCLVAVALAYAEEKRQRPLGLLIAVVVAIIFNPFVPLHLDRMIWMPIDLATAVWLAAIASERLLRRMPTSLVPLIPISIVGIAVIAVVGFDPPHPTSPALDESRNIEAGMTPELLAQMEADYLGAAEAGGAISGSGIETDVENGPFADVGRSSNLEEGNEGVPEQDGGPADAHDE